MTSEPRLRMSALERFQMMESDPNGYAEFGRAAAAGFDARIKAAHDAHGCRIWETWTEKNVRVETADGIIRDDVTFKGCRSCHVAIALQEEAA